MVIWFGKHRGLRIGELTFESICDALSDHGFKSPEWWVFQGELKRRDRLRELSVDYVAITQRGNTRKRRGSAVVVRQKAAELRKYIGSDLGDRLAGQQSPWGVPYPESWGMMSSREQREWKVRESASFANRPLGEKVAQAASNVRKPTHVKPVIPQTSIDALTASKFANVARSKELGVNGEVEITADECPY
jgi:hypothetical protein